MNLPAEIGYAPGQIEPRQCAITGQPVIGRHAVTFYLKDGFYYRIQNKALYQHNPNFHEAMMARLDEHLASVAPKPAKTNKEKES